MAATVVLEWKFSPPSYFEEGLTIQRQHVIITIADGKVVARIPAAIYDKDPVVVRANVEAELRARFLAAQIIDHKHVDLAEPTLIRIDSEGRRHLFVEVEAGHVTVTGGMIDVEIRNKAGNIVSSSRTNRIARRNEVADLAGKHASDELLIAMLASYDDAIRDPRNELIYLYEVRDAIAAHFHGQDAAQAALGIDRQAWSRFGFLCCTLPLRQGRHRGHNVGALRDASEDELNEARTFARNVIDRYLRYLA